LVKNDLKTLFLLVETCIEAPEKVDHGDLDIVVVPHPNDPIPSMEDIAEHLRADKWYHHQGSGTRQFAIPWPEGHYPDLPMQNILIPIDTKYNTVQPRVDAAHHENIQLLATDSTSLSVASMRDVTNAESLDKEPSSQYGSRHVPRKWHIQLDLKIIHSNTSLRWALFNHAHGDIINIISSMIRSKGLTMTDQALYLRIANLESQNRNLARVELTRDPDQALAFLGLDTDQFWRPFSTRDEMMRYIATCRFYDPKCLSGVSAEKHPQAAKGSLNKGDHKRLELRPTFAYWYNTFIPNHENDQPGAQAYLTCEETLDFTFQFFGDDTKQRYESQACKADTFIAKCRLWSDIRKQIIEKNPTISEKDMHDTLKALKREIMPISTSAKPDSTSSDDYNINGSQTLSSSSPPAPPAPSSAQLTSPLTPIQQAYVTDDLPKVITWSLANHATALTRYKQHLATTNPSSSRKATPSSKPILETTHTPANDTGIQDIRSKSQSWPSIVTEPQIADT